MCTEEQKGQKKQDKEFEKHSSVGGRKGHPSPGVKVKEKD